MSKYRKNRIDDALAAEAAVIVRDIKDPRLDGVMLTVTGADVTPDLKYAKIFYSVIGEYDEKELSKGLRSASSFVRSRLAQSLNLRITPEISFVYDHSSERGAHISELIRSVSSGENAREVSNAPDGETSDKTDTEHSDE